MVVLIEAYAYISNPATSPTTTVARTNKFRLSQFPSNAIEFVGRVRTSERVLQRVTEVGCFLVAEVTTATTFVVAATALGNGQRFGAGGISDTMVQ